MFACVSLCGVQIFQTELGRIISEISLGSYAFDSTPRCCSNVRNQPVEWDRQTMCQNLDQRTSLGACLPMWFCSSLIVLVFLLLEPSEETPGRFSHTTPCIAESVSPVAISYLEPKYLEVCLPQYQPSRVLQLAGETLLVMQLLSVTWLAVTHDRAFLVVGLHLWHAFPSEVHHC